VKHAERDDDVVDCRISEQLRGELLVERAIFLLVSLAYWPPPDQFVLVMVGIGTLAILLTAVLLTARP
jgi:hypothetical protein